MFVGGSSVMTSRLISTLMRFAVVFAVANLTRLVFAAPFRPMASDIAGSVLVESWADNEPNAFADSVTLTDGFDDGGSEVCVSCTDGSCRSSDCEECRSGLVNKWLQRRAHQRGQLTARIDAMLLWRDAPGNRPLFSEVNGTTIGPVALNADQLESDVLAAPRVSLFHGNGCGDAFEATYIYAGNFYSQRSLPTVIGGYALSPPGIYGNTWGPSPDPQMDTSLNSASATLLGSLQSLELNARTQIGSTAAQFLFGIRWVQWNETLAMQDTFSNAGPPMISGNDFYNTNCLNDLYGGQIGIDSLLLSARNGIRIEGLVKAGAYYNNAVQKSTFFYDATAPFAFQRAISVGRSPAAGSFVGEVGITAVVPLRRNWDFRCGYIGLWLESIAQPSYQLSNQLLTQVDTPAGSLVTNGGLVLQGLSLGLEGRW